MSISLKFAATAVLLSTLAWGQSSANRGEIFGTVFDANQAVVPNAKVTIKNTNTGLTREVTTAEAGQYKMVSLDPGTYQVAAESSGFAQSTVEGIPVTVGSSIQIDVTLQVSGTTTTVEVADTLINIAPAPANTLNTAAITNLPINGRRFQDFATLTPTVQVDPSRGQLSFAGQRGINSNIMLDGADYNQPFFGGIRGGERSNSIITVPQTAIQEFQVVTTGYTAEYGRSTGGVLNTITKSGGNNVHGEAFYQIRHKEMGAKDPVQNIASLETLQQFGGSIGGPVKKDKWFLFGAAEAQRSRTPRQVLFSTLIGVAPTAANGEALNFLNSQQQSFAQTNNASAFTARSDYQWSTGDRLTLRYNVSDATAANAVSVGTSISPFTNRALSNDGIEKDRIHNGTLQHTHIFTPSVINDLRFTGSYEERPRLSNSALPQVTNTAVGTFGARNFLPTTQDDKRWQITDSLSMLHGAHSFKFGFDYNRLTAAQVFGFNQFGGFSIAGSNVNTVLDILGTGGSIANRFDSNDVSYSRQIGNLQASMGMHQVAGYAQDSWRVRKNLTLDFGVRWEGQFNPKPEANNTDLLSRVNGFVFPNGASIDPTTIKNAPAQFMPRFGFAWTPSTGSRRTIVRGHTGIFYASTPLIIMAGPANNFRTPPGDVSITINPVNGKTVYQQFLEAGVDLNQFSLNDLPVLSLDQVQRAAAAGLGTAPNPFNGVSLITMAPDFQNPRSAQAGLGVETEAGKGIVLGAQFNYVNTVHLQRNVDYNLPLPFVKAGDQSLRPNFGLRTGTARPLRTLGSITARASSARSMYRGFTLSAQRRGSKFQFGGFYTWSEAFSDDDTERDATGFNYSNPFNFQSDYGYSRLDYRHQFTSYALYSLPLGFEVSGTFSARSGFPINPVTGGDTNEEFGNNDRPFTAPGVQLERNSFRNRTVVNSNNLRIMKNFRLGGSDVRRIQFSAELFNFLNLDNVIFSGPNGSGITGGVYGAGYQPNGTVAAVDPRFMRLRLADGTYDRNNSQSGSPLQAQFGLRLFF